MLQESLYSVFLNPKLFVKILRHTYLHVWELKHTYIHTYAFAPYLGFQKYLPHNSKKKWTGMLQESLYNVFLNPKLFVIILRHTYLHVWELEHTYIHLCTLSRLPEVPSLTIQKKNEQECSRRAFTVCFWTLNFSCENFETYIHTYTPGTPMGTQTYIHIQPSSQFVCMFETYIRKWFVTWNIHTQYILSGGILSHTYIYMLWDSF